MNFDLPRRLFRAGLEPIGQKVNTYSVMKHLKDLLAILKPDEIDVFKQNEFEKLFQLAEKPKWSSRFGIFLLTRQLEVSKKNEIWVLFGGKPVRLSMREFKLVTGLKCGKIEASKANESTPYYYTLFGRDENMTVKKVLAILNKRSTTNREMRLRYACLVIVEGLLLPSSQNSKITKDHADMVANLDTFFAHPWGRVSFDAMISSIKERSTWELANHSVAVHGFFPALQLVVLEAAPAIQKHKKGQELEDSNSDDAVVVEIGAKNEVNLANARTLDKRGEVDVQSIIFPDVVLDAEEEDLSWSDDGVDERVDRMVKLVEEKFSFNKSLFKGGCDPSKLVKPVKKQPKTPKPANAKGKKTKEKEKVQKGRRTSQASGATDGHQDNDESGTLTLSMVEELLESKLATLRTIIRDELTEAFESHSKFIDTKLQKAQTNVVTKVTDWFSKNTSVCLDSLNANTQDGTSRHAGGTAPTEVPVCNPTRHAVQDKVNSQTNALQNDEHGSTSISNDLDVDPLEFASETAAYYSGIHGTAPRGKHHAEDSSEVGDVNVQDNNNPDEERGEKETGEEDELSQEESETQDEEEHDSDKEDENSKEPVVRSESPTHMVTQNPPEEVDCEELPYDEAVTWDWAYSIGLTEVDFQVFQNATDAQNAKLPGNDSVEKEIEKDSSDTQNTKTDGNDCVEKEREKHFDGVDEGAQSEVPHGEEGKGDASKDGVVEGDKNAGVTTAKEVQDEVSNEGNVETLPRASKRPRTVSSKLDGNFVVEKKIKRMIGHPDASAEKGEPEHQLDDVFTQSMELFKINGIITIVEGYILTEKEAWGVVEGKKQMTSKVMDSLLEFSRHQLAKHCQAHQKLDVGILDSKFVSQLTRLHPKFCKVEKKTDFNFSDQLLDAIRTHVNGPQVTTIYMPFNFDRQHWVTLIVNIASSHIRVMDSKMNLYSASKLDSVLTPLASLLPHVLSKASVDRDKLPSSLNAFEIERLYNIPQVEATPFTGLMTFILMERHIYGGLEACKKFDPALVEVEGKKLVTQIVKAYGE